MEDVTKIRMGSAMGETGTHVLLKSRINMWAYLPRAYIGSIIRTFKYVLYVQSSSSQASSFLITIELPSHLPFFLLFSLKVEPDP